MKQKLQRHETSREIIKLYKVGNVYHISAKVKGGDEIIKLEYSNVFKAVDVYNNLLIKMRANNEKRIYTNKV